MTLNQYFATPETLVPQEVVFGGFRAADAPFSMHQRVVARLFVALHDHVEPRGLGEVWLRRSTSSSIRMNTRRWSSSRICVSSPARTPRSCGSASGVRPIS